MDGLIFVFVAISFTAPVLTVLLLYSVFATRYSTYLPYSIQCGIIPMHPIPSRPIQFGDPSGIVHQSDTFYSSTLDLLTPFRVCVCGVGPDH
jgi:hypothetical protein